MNENSNIKNLDLSSQTPDESLINELKKLMPEVFSESGVDFEKLKVLLGDEIESDHQERYAFT